MSRYNSGMTDQEYTQAVTEKILRKEKEKWDREQRHMEVRPPNSPNRAKFSMSSILPEKLIPCSRRTRRTQSTWRTSSWTWLRSS